MNFKLLSAALLALPLLVASNISYGQTNQDQLTKPNKEMEVIEVNPNNFITRTRLKKQLIKKQNEFIALYNSLAADPDFRVFCRKVAKIGSHFKKRRCTPVFYDKKEILAVQKALTGSWLMPSSKALLFSVRKERAASLQDMYQKMIVNPKLKKIVEEFKELNEDLIDTL